MTAGIRAQSGKQWNASRTAMRVNPRMNVSTATEQASSAGICWNGGTVVKRHRIPKPKCLGGGTYSYEDFRSGTQDISRL